MAFPTDDDYDNLRLDMQTIAAVTNGAAGAPDVVSRLGQVIKPLAKVMAAIFSTQQTSTASAATAVAAKDTAVAAAASVAGVTTKTNLLYDAFTTVGQAIIGRIGTLTTGMTGDNSTWVLYQAISNAGPDSKINLIEVFALTAGSLEVYVFNKSGDTYTWTGETIAVTMAAGLNSFNLTNFTGITVQNGQYIGWYANNRVALTSGSGLSYYSGTGKTFTDASVTSGYNFHIRFGYSTSVIKTLGDNSVERKGGVYPFQIGLVESSGQSLSQGSTPTNTAITTAQEYDNVGFPGLSNAPSAFLPLTVANCQVNVRGENPTFGCLGHAKELILEENAITYQNNDFMLAAVTNGQDGGAFSTIWQGTTPYTLGLSQITSGKTIANSLGKSFGYIASLLTHGETDNSAGVTTATYAGWVKTYADNKATDAKAITGQTLDPILIVGQMATGTTRAVALGQLQAANEHPLVYLAGPSYQYTYSDNLHRNAEGQKNYGGLLGLVLKRVVVDKVDWEPLQPVAHAVLGNTIDLFFNKDGLTFDITSLPAQTNMGFAVYNASDVAVTISSVAIISSRRIRITLAAPPSSGFTVWYGRTAMTGRADVFTGGGGNLRDNQGDRLIYRSLPVHNWSVIFAWGL